MKRRELSQELVFRCAVDNDFALPAKVRGVDALSVAVFLFFPLSRTQGHSLEPIHPMTEVTWLTAEQRTHG